MAKTTNLYVRLDPELKEQAELVLGQLDRIEKGILSIDEMQERFPVRELIISSKDYSSFCCFIVLQNTVTLMM
jgi:hypothetical protein